MRAGVRIGVDLGSVRIGVCMSDRDGILATPLETIPRGDGDLDRLVSLAQEHQALEFVLGMPTSLSGDAGPAAQAVTEFAQLLAARVHIDVRLVDERMSTNQAARSLQSAGRSSKQSRKIIDQQAAVVILQAALDLERALGRPAGLCGKVER